ncbi:MAG: hypothetical protein HQL21_05440 [Candidatus Omnitrophica bacterium]|nr:hypothetical protein [Candidatus Omnitrophota bacterium]
MSVVMETEAGMITLSLNDLDVLRESAEAKVAWKPMIKVRMRSVLSLNMFALPVQNR